MSVALYNRYRPRTFAEVVGQDHVTEALMAALRSGRVHHAYLFSGPRGCGKTSSARILAASLNCVDGPTPTPCGVCEFCLDVRSPAPLYVEEVDAASHGSVEDTRSLAASVALTPGRARYRILIIDEAHMVSPAGWNALLKVVEEPPPHVRFVFATTEPDKVIPTIRSRTFHYRFRLVSPSVLTAHLAGVCAQEGAEVDPAVLPMVVRAGAGSVRDALSVLDQLLAGAGPWGLTGERAAALLGLTDAVLLDEAVDHVAARDGSALFALVDRVVSSGHDPRRFAADLLERMRDLVVLDAVPDASERGLLAMCSPDQLDRMRRQASALGPGGLTRAAELLHAALVEMRGTTSPRLLLELVMARVLLPDAASDAASLLARLERMERRLAVVGDGPVAPAPLRSSPPPTAAPDGRGGVLADSSAQQSAAADRRGAAADGRPGGGSSAGGRSPSVLEVKAPAGPASSSPPAASDSGAAASGGSSAQEPTPAASPRTASPTGSAGVPELEQLRGVWDTVLEAAKRRKKTTHALLLNYAELAEVRGNTVVLTFALAPIRRNFMQGINVEVLTEALAEVTGSAWRVEVPDESSAVRGAVRPAPVAVDPRDEEPEDTGAGDEPGLSRDQAALAALRAGLGATVVGEVRL